MRKLNIALFATVFPVLILCSGNTRKLSVDCTKFPLGLLAIEYSMTNISANQEFNIPLMFLAGGQESWIKKHTAINSLIMVGANYRRFINQNIFPEILFFGLGARMYSISEDPTEENTGFLSHAPDTRETFFVSLEPELGFEKRINERLFITAPLGFGAILLYIEDGERSKTGRIRPMMHFGIDLGYRF